MTKLSTSNFLYDFHLRNFFIFFSFYFLANKAEGKSFSRYCNKTHSMPVKDEAKKWLSFAFKRVHFSTIPKTILRHFFPSRRYGKSSHKKSARAFSLS
jgi:hypothetical protein